MVKKFNQKSITAIITGVTSILISILYLFFIFILDSRGPISPPPAEALGEVEGASSSNLVAVQQPAL